MCVGMENNGIHNDILEGFADLTARLEDTTILAVQGQSHRRTKGELTGIAERIREEVDQIESALTNIEHLLSNRRNF